ncbi:PhzF family phenazine biosynthesis isomerase [Chelativorans sp. ZYF759]|uniref:PhzF family phenazine biosynthesis protein n=1 Tax=Chelativorans sp. ZYF759 TaxID=2692213 RepID=UPI00145EB205|nr:PhzF family phenazine biosynthesis protein [Chelativorans sp. ZYF759]NMG41326.1 PhzF family phenazine biosynthesis isomerase [Chelativorans sp. ZYF759]
MSERRYLIYDVFTDTALAGNPLAVVLDAEGLDTRRMQAIAREFNLSETVFVLPARNPVHQAALRIFTPGLELPFAGHPTVGTAIALAEEQGVASGDGAILVLEEKVGDVRCVVGFRDGANFAEFDLPKLSEKLDFEVPQEMIGAALGLGPHEIGFENHVPALRTAGVPYVTVPVADLDAAGRARLDQKLWGEIAPVIDGVPADAYVYCRETVNHDCHFHARMFAPKSGIPEDPATGSAAAAFSGAVLTFDAPPDGPHAIWIEQGIEMGRPSRIRLEMEISDGKAVSARIGGHAVRVAEGRLYLD